MPYLKNNLTFPANASLYMYVFPVVQFLYSTQVFLYENVA